MCPLWMFLILILGLISTGLGQSDIGSSCSNGWDGSSGLCVPFADCPSINEVVRRIVTGGGSSQEKQRVQSSLCENRRLVCCSDVRGHSSQVQKSLFPNHCGTEGASDLIVGGEDAPLLSNPWIAVLRGRHPNKRSSWICGGSLISDLYVLTAAHCFGDDGSVILEHVRIGEHNLARNPDCEDGLCADPPQDIPPEDVIRHPSYGSPCKRCNDIALIRLSRPATFKPGFVSPICLPRNPTVDLGFSLGDLNGKLARAAGWGTVSPDVRTPVIPTILQQAYLPIQETRFCSILKKNFPDSSLAICAGGHGKDTCRGDSGGPLAIKSDRNNKYYLVGVTSQGPANCGARDTVGLYTNVHPYIPWIQETML